MRNRVASVSDLGPEGGSLASTDCCDVCWNVTRCVDAAPSIERRICGQPCSGRAAMQRAVRHRAGSHEDDGLRNGGEIPEVGLKGWHKRKAGQDAVWEGIRSEARIRDRAHDTRERSKRGVLGVLK